MDTLRGTFESLDDLHDYASEDDSDRESPPTAIGQDERRMQVRAYNLWAGLLGNRKYPSIDDLEPGNLPDFGPYSVLLDFTNGIDNPGVAYLGERLGEECGAHLHAALVLADRRRRRFAADLVVGLIIVRGLGERAEAAVRPIHPRVPLGSLRTVIGEI